MIQYLYCIIYIDIQNDSYSFFLIVMDVLQIDLGLGLPTMWHWDALGYLRCLVWASMMLSLKLPSTTCVRHLSKKSALDHVTFFWGGRLHAPNFSSKCLGLCTMCSPRCIGLTLRAIVIRGRELLANPLVGYVTVPRRWFQSRSSVCYGSYEKL